MIKKAVGLAPINYWLPFATTLGVKDKAAICRLKHKSIDMAATTGNKSLASSPAK